MWMLPVIFFVGGVTADKIGYGVTFIKYIAMPLFFICFLISGAPFLKKEISLFQYGFWGGLVPFLIWVFAVFFGLGVDLATK